MIGEGRVFFSARLIAGWLTAAALTTALSLALLSRPDSGEQPDRSGPTTYSRSAIGYSVLSRVLEAEHVPVAVGTAPEPVARARDALVIAEPRNTEAVLRRVRAALRGSGTFVLVLPKRRGVSDPKQPDFIADDYLVSRRTAADVLRLVDPSGSVVRPGTVRVWTSRLPGIAGPSLGDPQLMVAPHVEPWLADADGVLIGETRRAGTRVVVVADPDFLENHGIARASNADLAVALLRRVLGPGGTVLFDEDVHGYGSDPLGLLRLVFGFPFVLITLQIAIAAALLAWSGAVRFGAPVPREPALGIGKRSLVESAARLLDEACDPRYVVERYRETLLRDAAAREHAPRGLSIPGLRAWFEARNRPAGDWTEPLPDAAKALAAAEAMYRWRNEVLDGSARHS
ncbi:MAG TPA: DUF4350 domain-containing protein [Candidatus Baltobacteraceae bacterium]|nr:DUF4350 domain-containing protein [Candidatus Baltobacteraceae bacterium]